MRVCFVTFVDLLGTSGQNVYSRMIAMALARRDDVELSLVCPTPSGPLPSPLDESATIRFLSKKRQRSAMWQGRVQLETYRALRSFHQESGVDLVVTPLKAGTLAPTLFARRTNIPHVLVVEGLISRNVRDIGSFPGAGVVVDGIAILNLLSSVKTIAAFDRVRSWLESLPLVTDPPVEVVRHGVDSETFIPVQKTTARSNLGIDTVAEEFVIGYVGSFKPRHRLDVFIKALDSLRSAGYSPRGILVGEGETKEEVTNLVTELGLEEEIHLPGYVAEDMLSDYVGACDVMYGVRDADDVSNPLKVYEYLACNRPVVAYETADIKFVEERDFGILVDQTTTNPVASAFQDVYDRLFERNEPFADSRGYIAQNHSWDNHAAAIVSAIDS